MKDVRKLTKKLSNYWWFPFNPIGTITNYHGNEGVINLLWVWKGQPEYFSQHHFDADFYVLRKLGSKVVKEAPIKDWATLLTLSEFRDFVVSNSDEFNEVAHICYWNKILTKKVKT